MHVKPFSINGTKHSILIVKLWLQMQIVDLFLGWLNILVPASHVNFTRIGPPTPGFFFLFTFTKGILKFFKQKHKKENRPSVTCVPKKKSHTSHSSLLVLNSCWIHWIRWIIFVCIINYIKCNSSNLTNSINLIRVFFQKSLSNWTERTIMVGLP